MPGWFGATFLGRISFILGGLDPCPDGLGHFFRDEVPQSARLSAGEGVQSLNGQCPNAFYAIFGGASLRYTMHLQRACSLYLYCHIFMELQMHSLLVCVLRELS